MSFADLKDYYAIAGTYTADFVALFFLILAWISLGVLIENPPRGRPSTSILMGQYNRQWMAVMAMREHRVFDSMALGTLRQGSSFFISATMIAIGGLLTLLGSTEKLQGVARDLSIGVDHENVWEIKILLVVILLSNGFFKFVWSHRLFGYCVVLMGSVPNDPEHSNSRLRAEQAADVNIAAVRNFNRGLRSIYFAFGSVAWLLGPLALLLAVFLTSSILLRREFAAQSRNVLLRNPEGVSDN